MKLETRENSAPKISVIVPIYKVEKYLCQCIDSILAQTLQDIEVILVDEGDLDACRAIIDMYEFGAKKDSRIKSIHEKNGGYGASVNKGMDIATGEYISIIESDDFIAPEMYEEMYNYAKKLDADVVKTPYYEYFDKTKNFPETIRPCFWQEWVVEIPEDKAFSIKEYPQLMGIHPSVWSCIYKKEYFDKYNVHFLTDRGAYVDHHFKAESLLNTEKIAWLNKPYYYYRLTNENASANNFNLPVMIKRWNEFHKLMQEKYPNRYSEFVEYNFREEYVNTYEKVFFEGYKISEKDFELLKDNLSYTTESQILNAKNINKFRLLKLVKLKENPRRMNLYEKKNKKNVFHILRMPLFTYNKHNSNTAWIDFINIPFIKVKKRSEESYICYLLGLIPIGKYIKY